MVTDDCARLVEWWGLGVGRRVVIGDVGVPSAGYYLSVAHDDGAYGDFTGFQRALGGAEGFLHPEFVGSGRWSLVVGRWHENSTQQGITHPVELGRESNSVRTAAALSAQLLVRRRALSPVRPLLRSPRRSRPRAQPAPSLFSAPN